MQSQRSDRQAARTDLSDSRILICDDSEIERAAVGRMLRTKGYEVDEAADGAAALQMLKRRGYNLLLLDLQMPEVDGFEVLTYVQKHQADLPVVVLSGLPPEQIGDGLQRLPQQELPPLLLKPVNTEQLFQVIELRLAGELP
jgi:CheY-like chemotaxis protein